MPNHTITGGESATPIGLETMLAMSRNLNAHNDNSGNSLSLYYSYGKY